MATYAIADLHGRYDLWEKVKKYLHDEDTLICLGDCIDRGPDGIQIVDEMRQRPHTTYLKGNHEDMAATALYNLLGIKGYFDEGNLWFYNGGYSTYESLEILGEEKQLEYANYFKNLPLEYTYVNKAGEVVMLNHAGFTPGKDRELLWDRSSFHDSWPYILKIKIIHGHTPVQYLEFDFGYDGNYPEKSMDPEDAFDKWDAHAIWYCGGHKCDIDLGSAGSNKTMLLDLDSWKEIYFETDVE